MVRELPGIDKFEVTSKLVKGAFVVAIEEFKLIEPLKNETLFEPDKLSCWLFDNEFKPVFKFVIFNFVRELSGIDNVEVANMLVDISFSALIVHTFNLFNELILSLTLSMIILSSILSYNATSNTFVNVQVFVVD